MRVSGIEPKRAPLFSPTSASFLPSVVHAFMFFLYQTSFLHFPIPFLSSTLLESLMKEQLLPSGKSS